MSSQFINSANEVTREWLQEILKTKISNFSTRENLAFNSSIVHVNVKYASNSEQSPENLIVKINKEHEGQNEIQFYRFAENIDLPMIPRRLSMNYDASSGLSYLIIEDISNTYTSPTSIAQMKELNAVHSKAHLESMVDAIANFHAAFWEHPLFGTIPDTTEMRWWYRDESFHAKHVERRTVEWNKFVEMHGKDVPKEWIQIGESTLEALPKLFENRIKPRLSPMRALTMSQGDCYLTQFLVPKTESGSSFLIDFQDACVNFPTYDLVYMFATFLTREQRAKYEEYLLKHYLYKLNNIGVKYTWNDLCDDYRLCVSYMLFDAVWNATAGSTKEYWFPKLQCLISAYQDWDCENL